MLNVKKTYLGDGCYAAFDGYHIVLTTENGIAAQNTIFLDEEVRTALFLYHKRILQAEAEALESAFAEERQAQEEEAQEEKAEKKRTTPLKKPKRMPVIHPVLIETYKSALQQARHLYARGMVELRNLKNVERAFAPLLYLLDANAPENKMSGWLSGSRLYVRVHAANKPEFSAAVREIAEKLDIPPNISVKPGEYMADFDLGNGFDVHAYANGVSDCRTVEVEQVVKKLVPHPECLAALQELEQL